MKVNGTFPVAGLEQYKAMRGKPKVSSAVEINQHDEIAFSKDATLFTAALKAAKGSISERINKSDTDIEGIKNQIQSGAYEINAGNLADSMLHLNGYYERR